MEILNFFLWAIWSFCALLVYGITSDVIKILPNNWAEQSKTENVILFAVTTTYVIGLPLSCLL